MLTSLERIGTVMQGKIPDRVPVFCNMFEQGAQMMGISIKEYYSKPEFVAEGQLKLREEYGYDGIWAFMHTAVITQVLGARNVIYSKDGPPNVGDLILKDFNDIKSFEIPEDIEDNQAMQDWIKLITILKNEVGDKTPILTSNVGSFSLPAILLGMEKWIELMLLGPYELRDELLEKCCVFNNKLVQSFRNAGVDIISYSNPLSTLEFITYKQFRSLCLPWIKKDFKFSGTEGMVYFNGGGRMNHIIDDLIIEVGIGAFYINPKDSVKEAKEIISGRGISSGVINDILLLSWKPEDIKNEVQRIMQEGANGGAFMFGTLVMPYKIPKKNIQTMLDAAYQFGSY